MNYFQGWLDTCSYVVVFFFFFNLSGHDKCCYLLCSTVRMFNMMQSKDHGLGNVACKFILGKEVRPHFSFCLSPGEGLGVSENGVTL